MKKRYISMNTYVCWRDAPAPIDWPGIFERRAPLELEIGCGNGEVLARRAADLPEHDFLAVDLNWPSVSRSMRRVAQAGLGNVRLTKGGADIVLRRMFQPRELSHVYCLFPCPWPKEKHEHKRLFALPFLRLMNSRLADGGTFRLVTDWEQFADWVAEQSVGSGFELNRRMIGAQHDTKYERRWQEGGQEEFFELNFSKVEHADVPPYTELKLQTPLLEEFDPGLLAEFEHTQDTMVVCCREFYYDPVKETALLRMIAAEDGFSQNFHIRVARREDDGKWQVRVAPGSGVLPSAAIQLALDTVAQRLREG